MELPAGSYDVTAGTDCNQSMFLRKDLKVSAGEVTSLDIKLNILYRDVAPFVSLWQIIANPESYHNRRIVVTGFLHLKFENSALYASKEDADYLIGKNAVWVTYSTDDLKLVPRNQTSKLSRSDLDYFDGKYVTLEGIFNKNDCGHMGSYSGTIQHVTRVFEKRRWYDGKRELK